MKFILLTLLLSLTPLMAHEVTHHVEQGTAIMVRFTYADQEPFSYEPYDVYAPGRVEPYVSGHSDASGYVVFRPDSKGEYRIKIYSEDGHGAEVKVNTEGNIQTSSFNYLKLPLGLVLLAGIFGLAYLLKKRKTI